jgi:Mn-dependent DtxR family transcriptional regulator
LRYLVHRDLLSAAKKAYDLTEKGRHIALDLLQKHRLWETYLNTIGLPEDHVHRPADELEHYIDDNLKEKLLAQLDESGHDPHGKNIPRPSRTS